MPERLSLGIDISGEKINLALLKQTRQGIKLLKAASAAVPQGAISNGNITDPVAIGELIKELKTREKISARQGVVSLVARPVLVQVMDLPKSAFSGPSNAGQYVQNEVKHCAILPSKNIAMDYCGTSPSKRSGRGRVFVVAAENEKITEMTRALSQAELHIQAIEPAVIACARALYAKKIAKKYDSNVLIAVVRDRVVELCVFRKESLDFIRSKDMGEPIRRSSEGLERLSEQIAAILQFYEIEVPDSSGNWQLVIAPGESDLQAKDIGEFLQSKFRKLEVQVSCPESICQDTPIISRTGGQRTSLAAVGLALKTLDTPQPKLQINLLPAETAELRHVKKHALITANVVAAVLIIMVLGVGLLSYKLKNADNQVELEQQKQLSEATQALLSQERIISEQVDRLSAKLDEIKQILPSGGTVDWSKVLNDIRQRTPKVLCITDLVSNGNSTLMMQGQSRSSQAVYLFVDMLGKSAFIDSAELIGTEKDDRTGGLLSYSITCSLTGSEGT